MDYANILKRAFQITLRYRALWIFGFFLALCSGGSGGGGGGQNFTADRSTFENGDFPDPFAPLLDTVDVTLIISIVSAIVCLILLLIIISIVVRSVTRASLIGMVNQVEETGAVTVREGWRIGWSKNAVTIFLINLVVGVPLGLLLFGTLLAALSPFALLIFGEDNPALLGLGIVAGIGLLLVWGFAVLVLSIVISAWLELSWRHAVLRGQGVLDSLKASFSLIRYNLKEVAITLLLLVGCNIGWALVSFILFIIVALIGLIAGAIPGLIAFLVTQEVWVAILVGLPIFFVVIIVPLTFVTGLFLIFKSSVWTLAFRELAGDDLSEALVVEETDDTADEDLRDEDDDAADDDL